VRVLIRNFRLSHEENGSRLRFAHAAKAGIQCFSGEPTAAIFENCGNAPTLPVAVSVGAQMTPEARARALIDQKLEAAGWVVQDTKQLNLGAATGVAVREYPTDTGPADYVLFVDREPIGVIEAKRDEAGANLNAHETQTERYANATLKWRAGKKPLRFLYESTGQIIWFTDGADPAPRARELFHFFQPKTLAEWAAQPDTLRHRLTQMPPLPERNLRDCQISAVKGLERSLAKNKPRALIHMATGAGKTFTAITSVYRLLKFGGAKRILFLVDTRNLGKQAHQEFMAYTPPDDGRKFTELYNVQQLKSSNIDPHAQVCISTIQRMYSILSGDAIDEAAEDISAGEIAGAVQQPRLVQYNPQVPIEAFDFIVIDECHRSIYNQWKQVLDYFDAFLIGLTATPDQRTYGFFKENVVAEYSYEQSVLDGVNVSYDPYEIVTEITANGAELKAQEWVDHRDRETRAKRLAQVEEDTPYGAGELDRSVVNHSQIRQVIQAMKTAVETRIFPEREETPKTLIFAKTDSHADDIIREVREIYAEGNAFCKKVTYRAGVDPDTGLAVPGDDADSVLANFRNEYNPRIAVTVDMIATGTDVKPLEVLLFMRDVRSRGYYEQMKGRGVRSLDAESLQRVSKSATGRKTHFVLIDAVGVEKSLKTESRSLERKPGVSLDSLLKSVAVARDPDTVLSLGNRLVRLAKQLDDKTLAKIKQASGGIGLQDLARGLVQALDPDRITAAALDAAHAAGITRNAETLTEAELEAARRQRVASACQPFDAPALREMIESARREREQLLDTINQDQVTFSGYSAEAQGQAEAAIRRFADYLAEHRDEIAALGFLYDQPYRRRALTLDMVEELHDAMARPPLMLTTERLWAAYARVQESRVRGRGVQRQLVDVVALVRFALGLDEELRPFADSVDKRFQEWVFRHNARRATAFTPEQMEWLRLVKDHIASSCRVERDDFDYAQLAGKGGLQKAWNVFGGQLDELLVEMNEELVA
jgi:type I restriction enzyme R subunit